jgi:hypothetical protein
VEWTRICGEDADALLCDADEGGKQDAVAAKNGGSAAFRCRDREGAELLATQVPTSIRNPHSFSLHSSFLFLFSFPRSTLEVPPAVFTVPPVSFITRSSALIPLSFLVLP